MEGMREEMFDSLVSEGTSCRTKPWTDDLKVCNLTGVGDATNQIYKEDGSKLESAKSRDQKCLCKVDDTSLYAIYSGHNGIKVADFALQKIAADILLGQLNGKTTDEAVKDVIRQGFYSVEKGYFDSIDSLVAKKTSLQFEIPDGLSQYEVSQKYKTVLDQLNAINLELSVGASVVLSLIYQSKLYIGNIGNCRALLCKTDEHNTLHVTQLSVDHNLFNEEESLRLCQLGLDIQNFENGPLYSTRCIGNYLGKAGYKDCDFLSDAASEPVIFRPEIVGSIQIDSSCRFLVLLSSGLCKSLYDVFPGDISVGNRKLIQMIAEEFQNQSTLMGVSQSVVHKIVQLHHDIYMRQIEENQHQVTFTNREDITLLIRNFDYPMPNAFNSRKHSDKSMSSTISSTASEVTATNSNLTDTDRSSDSNDGGSHSGRKESILPYVDFTPYYKRVEEAMKEGKFPDFIFD